MATMAYETPIGTFTRIELAEQKLIDCDFDKSMVKCIILGD